MIDGGRSPACGRLRLIMMRPKLLLAATAAIALGAAASASAAAPTGDYVNFKYCPYTNPGVATCVNVKTTSGSLQVGTMSVPITPATPIVLQGGFGQEAYPTGAPWFNAVGADTLSKTKLKVPGGLPAVVDAGSLGGLIIPFNAAVASTPDVYATIELVAAPELFLTQLLLTQESPGLKLPVRIHLENPFLGANCFIGSAASPVSLVLQTGTTSPPSPNVPISGGVGTTTYNADFSVSSTAGGKLVDNAFAAPAVTTSCGSGLLLDRVIITAAVNNKLALPSPAGKNTIIKQGTWSMGGAAETAASVH
jgi:hypothetical protein